MNELNTQRSNWAQALNGAVIASTCSPRHIQSVIEQAAGHIVAAERERVELARAGMALLTTVALLVETLGIDPETTEMSGKANGEVVASVTLASVMQNMLDVCAKADGR